MCGVRVYVTMVRLKGYRAHRPPGPGFDMLKGKKAAIRYQGPKRVPEKKGGTRG